MIQMPSGIPMIVIMASQGIMTAMPDAHHPMKRPPSGPDEQVREAGFSRDATGQP